MTGPESLGFAYRNRTVHVRLQPFRRKLDYTILQILLDIDRIAELAAPLRLFAYNRPGVFSFHDKDHGDRSGARLRPWAERAFASGGIDLEGGRIMLLCLPRVFGFVFNPLSVYFGYGPDGALRGVLYEVNNTFGDTHTYVTPYTQHAAQHAPKRLYVSPFFTVVGAYEFRVQPPGETFALSILNRVDGVCTHAATLTGRRLALTDARLARTLVAMPFMTLGVVAAIHWEALFLWLRGAAYTRRPAPPEAPFTVPSAEPSVTSARMP